MSVDKATVERVAHLARIAVREDELEQLASELNTILSWIEQLNEVDTDAVEPMASVHDEMLRQRTDEVADGDKQADVLANAPEIAEDQFVVPRVIE